GEMDGFAQDVAVYERLASELQQPQYGWRVAYLHAVQHLLAGQLAEAESRAGDGLQLGLRVEYEPIWVTYGPVLAMIRCAVGRLQEREPPLGRVAARSPGIPDGPAALVCGLVERGPRAGARAVFERLAADDFSSLRRRSAPSFTLALLAAGCDALGDARRA